ncbi:MAG: lamin tail domain-containing protein [Lentisphaerota bacterium]
MSLIEIPANKIGPSSRRTGLILSEIMYNPPDRPDGKELEYIELYNTMPFCQSLGSYQLSGSIQFSFPADTVISGQTFMVVAKNAADLESVYGSLPVAGSFSGSLPGEGTVTLLNNQDAVLLSVEYEDGQRWPVAADGAGHSMVLSSPSYGERDPRAWSASVMYGGSPGEGEPVWSSSLTNVVINEFLAHTDFSTGDYIEVYNRSRTAVDLTGCFLSKYPATNQFTITGQSVPPRAFLAWMTNQTGFNLESEEGAIFLCAPNSNVLDAVRYEAQQNSMSAGRYPDGSPGFQELNGVTRCTNNRPRLSRDIVINEIMYHPISDNGDDEYIEIYNRGTNNFSLSSWRFVDGVDFTFPEGTVLLAGNYLVIAKNAEHLLSQYAQLNSGNLLGDYSGSLADGGERVALAKPDDPDLPNEDFVIVDEVNYSDGGHWGKWSDGGGSSLELRDPRSDNKLAANWSDSDETGKSSWTHVTFTGILDLGNNYWSASINELHVMMLREGECLFDSVVVSNDYGSGNLVGNSTFESGLGGWTIEGTLARSSLENEGYGSSRSLHIRASGGGDTGANRIKTGLSGSLSPGSTATIGAYARWMRGSPYLLMRVRGNYLEATAPLPVPDNLGTPGLQNSCYAANTGPAIYDVSHVPILPAAQAIVTIRARADDPDGIQQMQVKYRLDPSTTTNTLTMTNSGSGVFSVTLPGRAARTMVAFHVVARDSNSITSTFPSDAPAHECLFQYGEIQNSTDFGTYRFWLSMTNIHTWEARAPLCDEPLDMTLAYNNERVIYNAEIRYRGSPFIRTYYTELLTGVNSYVVSPPKDDLLLGSDEFNLDTLEPWESRDNTRMRERLAFHIASELGLPYSYQRLIHMALNGNQHSDVYADTHHVNSDYIETWFPEDSEGDLYKFDDWFEFGNNFTEFVNADASLQDFTTTGGEKKKARYRWNLERKANGPYDDDYTNLYQLVDMANLTGTPYPSGLASLADVEEWMRLLAFRHAVVDWDAYGYNRGKNMFAYKPVEGKWKLLLWDLDMGLGASVEAVYNRDLLEISSNTMPVIARVLAQPPFKRAYWQGLLDAVEGPMTSASCDPLMDEWFYAMQYSGVAATNPSAVKSWISNRRGYILSQMTSLTNTALSITSHGGTDFSVSSNLLQLTGTAPIQAREIRINGVSYVVDWNSETSWTAAIALQSGTNTLNVQAYDADGNMLASLADSIKVNFTGSDVSPVGSLVINEIMYNPAITDAEFIEIVNLASNAIDLYNYRLQGAGLVFGESTVIQPGEYLVVAESAPIFAATYGPSIRIAAVYPGALKNGDELLRLVKPGVTGEPDVLVDEVWFEENPPWPTNADGGGASLQLMDVQEDNNRVGNWAVSTHEILYTPGAPNNVATDLPPFPLVWLNELQSTNISGLRDNYGEREPWLELFNAETDAMDLTNMYLTDDYADPDKWSFETNAIMAANSFMVVWADAQTTQTVYMTNHVNFRLSTTTGSVALVASNDDKLIIVDYVNYAGIPADRSFGDYPDGVWSNRVVFGRVSPGATNNNAGVVRIYINEWMADNASTLVDPADGDYDDWFELYNATTGAVDLAGYTLTDTLSTPAKWVISNNTWIAAGGFLLVWADGEPRQNTNGVHASFSLSKGGEAIGLYTSDGVPVDTVTFGAQATDTSEGRWWDGQGYITNMAIPTPGSNNIVSIYNSPPVLGAIGNHTIGEGHELSFVVMATDTDRPQQKLAFSLDPGAPASAGLNPDTGGFTWTPDVEEGPSTNSVTIRVADNGWPAMSSFETFLIFVEKVNRPPVVGSISNVCLGPGSLLTIQVTATDPDVPPDALIFQLEPGYPAGASMDPDDGLFQWAPSDAQASTTNLILISVSDDGLPVLSDTNSFTVFVRDMNSLLGADLSSLPVSNRITISWDAETGATYRLQVQTNLFDAGWTTLPGEIVASNSVASLMDEPTNSLSLRFYRIQQILP